MIQGRTAPSSQGIQHEIDRKNQLAMFLGSMNASVDSNSRALHQAREQESVQQ